MGARYPTGTGENKSGSRGYIVVRVAIFDISSHFLVIFDPNLSGADVQRVALSQHIFVFLIAAILIDGPSHP